jgi:methionine-rich copper-binding protein CopC
MMPTIPSCRRATAPATGLLLAITAVLAVLTPAAPAWAHNSLVEAVPAKNAKLVESPPSVRLRFLAKLNPDSTTVTVTGAGGRPAPAAKPSVKAAVVSVKFTGALPNGTYVVAYKVASTDGHTVKGSYRFTVADPTPPAAAAGASPAVTESALLPSATPASTTVPSAPAAVPVAATEAADDQGFGTTGVALIVGGVLVVAGLAGLLIARRRRTTG